jgi:hypothetical protein
MEKEEGEGCENCTNKQKMSHNSDQTFQLRLLVIRIFLVGIGSRKPSEERLSGLANLLRVLLTRVPGGRKR